MQFYHSRCVLANVLPDLYMLYVYHLRIQNKEVKHVQLKLYALTTNQSFIIQNIFLMYA